LTLEEINPFFFDEPVAPLAAAGKRKNVRLDTVLGKIRAVARRCDVLLVEGIGGLLVPCGEKVTVLDIIKKLRCPVLVVSRNRLGTINHTLLTINVLETSGIENFAIVMMGVKKPDISARNNVKIIQKMAPGGPVFEVPRLKFRGSKVGGIKINVTFLKKTLARILGDDSFNAVLPIKRRKG
jgi:dethiobiotin synthetase